MRDLHKYIQDNYGREALQELQQWEKWELRYSNYSITEGSLLDVLTKGLKQLVSSSTQEEGILAVGSGQSSTGQKDNYFKKELEALTTFFWTMG